MPETRELGEALLPPLSPPADIPQGIADVSLDGLTVKFRVENGQDVIQRFHIMAGSTNSINSAAISTLSGMDQQSST